MTTPAHLIAARTWIFSDKAVAKLTRTSRTKRWRERDAAKKAKAEAEAGTPPKVATTVSRFPTPVKPNERFSGYQGVDVVQHMQQMRADAGLAPMDEADILIALLEAQAEADREKEAARAERARRDDQLRL